MDKTVDAVNRSMSKRQARQLTERIRQAAEDCWRLLCEAREREAWRPLGYSSWDEYVRAEFGMSDRNARYLLAQGEVISRLESAADVHLPAGTVSGREARVVSGRIDEVAGRVAQRTRRQAKVRRPAIVAEVVSEAVSEARDAPPVPPSANQMLGELVRVLAKLNPVVAAREATSPQRRAIDAWWEAYRLAGGGQRTPTAKSVGDRRRPSTRTVGCDHPVSARVSQGKGRGFRCRLCGETVHSAA